MIGFIPRLLLKVLALVLILVGLGGMLDGNFKIGLILLVVGMIVVSVTKHLDRKARIYNDEIVREKARRRHVL